MRFNILTNGGGSLFDLITGNIIHKPVATTPIGFLMCNGAYVAQASYSGLFAVIGNSFDVPLTPGLDYVSYGCVGGGKPWMRQYDTNVDQTTDITGWTTDASLPGPLSNSQAIVTKNRVYLLGGNDGTNTPVPTVYTAPINPDGTLVAWATSTSLPGALAYSQAIVTSNRVYLLGGGNGAVFVSTVYTAPINPDGTLGPWSVDVSLPVILAGSQAIVTKNRVYLLGGRNLVTPPVQTVYTAPINPDGTLGIWTVGTSLPGPLAESQAIVTKNRVYLLGGDDGTAYVGTVFTAPINPDGTLGLWATGTSLPNDLHGSQAIVTKTRVFLISGFTQSLGGGQTTVYTAPINPDGTLGAWVTGSPAIAPTWWHQAIVTKNRIYLLGGFTNPTVVINAVYSAPILGGLNDYTSFYNGHINKFDGSDPITSTTNPSPSTMFSLPDYTTFDLTAEGLYSYIKT